MLKKDAQIWWDVVKQTRDSTQMTWTEFEVLFNEKFHNTAILTSKINEFHTFQQGNLSVATYAKKFDHLAKFAPDMVPNDTIRVNCILEGLKPKLVRDVDMGHTGPMTYAQVVERAL